MTEKRFTCPVCGYPSLEEPHVDPTGEPTYSICPCCGTHFGADDVDRSHDDLRREWLANGAEWWSMREPQPAGWDPKKQLEAAGFSTSATPPQDVSKS